MAKAGGLADADPDTSYIRISLARPVPKDGETRLLILKTYRDPKSYFAEGRPSCSRGRSASGATRSCCRPGYELVSLNVPSQVLPRPTAGWPSAS